MTALPPPIVESIFTVQSGGRAVRVERYEPNGGGPYPPLLLLHGSDGFSLGGALYHDLARDFARAGYRALLPHYLEATGTRFSLGRPAPAQFLAWADAVRATLTDALAAPGTESGRAGLVGISLGAYLALTVAAGEPRVAAVVECFGGLPDAVAAQAGTLPPVLILHGDADPLVPVSEAYKLERLLRAKGVPYEMKIYPRRGHGFVGADARDAQERSRRFLDRHLRGATPAAQPPYPNR